MNLLSLCFSLETMVSSYVARNNGFELLIPLMLYPLGIYDTGLP